MLQWAECGFACMQTAEDTWLFFEEETSQFVAQTKHHDGPVVTVKALYYCKGQICNDNTRKVKLETYIFPKLLTYSDSNCGYVYKEM